LPHGFPCLLYQDGLLGPAWGHWALYTASSLQVLANELGVQGPVGFWDPLGFSSDGNAERLHCRQTELKHVGISMLATITTSLLCSRASSRATSSRSWASGSRTSYSFAVSQGYQLQVGLYHGVWGILRVVDGSVGRLWFRSAHIQRHRAVETKLSTELTNGRFSIMALLAVLQDGLAGPAWIGWAKIGSSKIDGKDYLLRHRAVEYKHGRVSLWACLDDVRPKYSKHGGYVSPSWASGFRTCRTVWSRG